MALMHGAAAARRSTAPPMRSNVRTASATTSLSASDTAASSPFLHIGHRFFSLGTVLCAKASRHSSSRHAVRGHTWSRWQRCSAGCACNCGREPRSVSHGDGPERERTQSARPHTRLSLRPRRLELQGRAHGEEKDCPTPARHGGLAGPATQGPRLPGDF